jgi:hypothetical protein
MQLEPSCVARNVPMRSKRPPAPTVAVWAFALWALLVACSLAHATEYTFASEAQGRTIAGSKDEYIERLGALERSLKTKSTAPVSEQAFLAIAASAVRPWQAEERASVESALETIRARLEQLRLPLPPQVILVRSSGLGEGGAPHTRGSAVFLTDAVFLDPANLAFVLAHEVFHVASRHNRSWRNAMYGVIGFAAIEEAVLPPALSERRLTNPDAPRLDAAIRVGAGDQSVWVMPLLQATVDRYDPSRGGEFFAYMRLNWVEIGRGDVVLKKAHIADPPRMLRTEDLTGFAEQIGMNTNYIIHPEEILADNFAQLVTGRPAKSPEVHQQLRRALTEWR